MSSDKEVFTREDRIKQLMEIDQNVVRLVKSAGEAVSALTSFSTDGDKDSSSIAQRKEAYTAAASQYFSLLSTVDVNVRRQIYALEEARIISAAEHAPKDVQPPAAGSNAPQSKERVTMEAGAIGNLDVGWLNSRNDKVGKEMEAELWAEARTLVDKLGKD